MQKQNFVPLLTTLAIFGLYACASLTTPRTPASAALENQLPVVTHWNAKLNNGLGGPQDGGTDTAGVLLDDVSEKIGVTGIPAGAAIPSRTFVSADPNDPYFYSLKNTALLNVKSPRPDFENYLGSNYAFFAFTDKYIADFSEKMLKDTGFPVVHRNGNRGCKLDELGLQKNLAAFQVVHACIYETPGGQTSLATLILPPHWNPDGGEKYPVLLYPFYDIHVTFHDYGANMIHSLAKVIQSGAGSGIGVLWNGGAALGTFGIQPHTYANISMVLDDLGAQYAADTQKIVAVGLSRGGSEALAIAGNPHPHSYRVPWVVAYSPATSYGTRDTEFRVPTYPGFLYVGSHMAGFKYSWRTGFHDPATGMTGEKVPFWNSLGTAESTRVDDQAAIADDQLAALKRDKTKVIYGGGSTDQFVPFGLALAYLKKLSDFGIPFQFLFGLRTGHSNLNHMEVDSVNALTQVNKGTSDFTPGVTYFHFESDKIVPFAPSAQPVFVDLPKYAVVDGPFLATFAGPPGMSYKLEVYPVGRSTAPVFTFSGQLPVQPSVPGIPIAFEVRRQKWLRTFPAGDYQFRFSYQRAGENWSEASLAPNISGMPAARPVTMKIYADEPMISGETFYYQLGADRGTSGLSSD